MAKGMQTQHAADSAACKHRRLKPGATCSGEARKLSHLYPPEHKGQVQCPLLLDNQHQPGHRQGSSALLGMQPLQPRQGAPLHDCGQGHRNRAQHPEPLLQL